jgi:hypothetical protein
MTYSPASLRRARNETSGSFSNRSLRVSALPSAASSICGSEASVGKSLFIGA